MGCRSLRRSFALPCRIVDEAISLAPEELKRNLNRLVTVALQEYIARKKEQAFEAAMQEMARDPAIRSESRSVNEAFLQTEMDGL
ncbi:MAG: hypothetical protein HYU64_13395 [Armatimonadetes bacterium]|nr:hypothetical protein [Armatimonadota bacterium]